MLLLHIVLTIVKEDSVRIMIQETLAPSADLMTFNTFPMAHVPSILFRHLVWLVIGYPVGTVCRLVHVYLHPMKPVPLIIGHRADAPVDGNLVKVRPPKAYQLCIGVRKQASLQQRIVTEIDSRHHVTRVKCHLLGLREEIRSEERRVGKYCSFQRWLKY